MTQQLWAGIGLTLMAGLMAGNCMLPMKFSRAWKWENTWFVFSFVSLIVLPFGLAMALVRHLAETYRSVPITQLAIPFFFGAGWGIAQVLFGISVQRLGLGLAYAIIIGLGAVLGTLVPLLVQHGSEVGASALMEILAGVLVMVVGIALVAWGGQIREQDSHSLSHGSPVSRYSASVLLAILCGVMAPMLNYAFAFGQNIAVEAVRNGNSQLHAGYAVWPIGLAGGFVPNITYSLYLLRKNRSWKFFTAAAPDFFWAALMGILWMGSMAIYGMSAIYLGTFGTSIGWGLFQIFMIVAATLSGVVTGEWIHAARKAILVLVSGMVGLVTATALLAIGNK
jgi:L-rhamnose-H+ transport protein